MLPFVPPLGFRKSAAAAGGTPVVRDAALYTASTGASRTVALPALAVAGDQLFVFVGSSWDASLISGYADVDHTTGANWEGRVMTKVLTAGDITTGTVTIAFAGSHGNVILLVATVGAVTVRTVKTERNSSGAGSRTPTTDASPVAGDLGLYFGAFRGTNTGTCTANRGTPLMAAQALTDAVGRGWKENLVASGAVSVTFSYGGSSGGDYSVILILHS